MEVPAQWPRAPADLRTAYQNFLLPWYRANKKDELPSVWDEYLRGETALQQISLAPAALAAWGSGEYKDLYWAKWLDLLSQGVNATMATGELVKIIAENPTHSSLKKWIADLAKVAEAMGGLKFDETSTAPKPPDAPVQ